MRRYREKRNTAELRSWFRRLFSRNKYAQAEDQIGASDETGHANLSVQEQFMLRNVIEFRDLRANDVMVPRSDIIAVEKHTTLDELRECLITSEHTRIPVYEESLDNVKGFIHTKDVLPYLGTHKNFYIQHILRDILFVSPSIKLVDLLLKMRLKRIHMALVLDEYGGIDGMVTIEDIMEEIVGEIEDEHDTDDEILLQRLNESTWLASGRVEVETFEKETGSTIVANEMEEFDTLGGYIFHKLGYVPKNGEEISHPSGIIFEVLEADPRRVKKIKIHLLANKSNYTDSESKSESESESSDQA
ncbi:MAG: HlyC/CorC family transporter [Alphaproteobacteria bacterium]|nr:HlyC/CorC family transporter [Alphaproteobacteria bacterium]